MDRRVLFGGYNIEWVDTQKCETKRVTLFTLCMFRVDFVHTSKKMPT